MCYAQIINVHTLYSVIKTRMQSLTARQAYRNSFHCAYRIFTEEGVLRFWTGTTPRLVRLMVSCASPVLDCFRLNAFDQLSGGIVFTTYENIMRVIGGEKEQS